MKRLCCLSIVLMGLFACNKNDGIDEPGMNQFSYKGGDYGLDLGLIDYTYDDSEGLYTYNLLLTSTKYITYNDEELNGTGYTINFSLLMTSEFPLSGTFGIPKDFRMLLFENNTYPDGNSEDAIINEFIIGELNISNDGDLYEIVFDGKDEVYNEISIYYKGLLFIKEQ
ncbi:unnamed protein product [Chrysoparadoxa australica]